MLLINIDVFSKYFANALKDKLGLDYAFANELEIIDGKLTGKVTGTIINAEQKALLVKLISQQENISLEQVVAIGDGANDAIAMKDANVSISLRGAMDISLRASDIYLTRDVIKGMHELFSLAKRAYFTIKFNLVLSLSYNLLGVSLAFMGIINPLVAAVLMPISSASVVIATLINLRGREL